MERSPRQVRFQELDALLRAYGFERRQRRRGSSHYVYTRGRRHLTVPAHRPHLRLYVVLEALTLLREIEAEEGEE
jgi:predicted RNA binding protein YcfA (HicA-like mRNA interferase family)